MYFTLVYVVEFDEKFYISNLVPFHNSFILSIRYITCVYCDLHPRTELVAQALSLFSWHVIGVYLG